MRAVIIERFGDPDGMAVIDRGEPTPAAGQVVIQSEAIGVGGVDAVIRRGTLGSGFPRGMTPGSEVAGRILAVGDDVDPAAVGRRVWAFTGTAGGAYAEQAVADIADTVPLPARLSPVDAVALGSAVPVAQFGLAHAHLDGGERVLVRGAGGSIGIAAVELAARSGAAVIAVTTSSAERGERLMSLGATHVLNRAGESDSGSPVEFDVILDVIGGPDLPRFIQRLAPNGRMVAVGIVGGHPPADFGTTILSSFRRSISFGTLSLDTVSPAELTRARSAAFTDAVAGRLHAVVDDVLPLTEASQAHRRMDDGRVFGRIVLVP